MPTGAGRAIAFSSVLLVVASGAALLSQASRLPPLADKVPQPRGVDFDGDGKPDKCDVVSVPGFSGLSCWLSSINQTVPSNNLDLGYPEGRAWVDFDGDGRHDFCRIVGSGYPNSFALCTLSEGHSFGLTLQSSPLDWGYPETRYWRDVNGDKKADFCRVVGSNRELLACTISLGRMPPHFGQTWQNPR
jgi:hypothetical protein